MMHELVIQTVTAVSLGGAMTASYLTYRRRSRTTYARNIERHLTSPFRNPLVPVFGPLIPKDRLWQQELTSLVDVKETASQRAGYKCFYSPEGTGLSYSVLSALQGRTDVVHANVAHQEDADFRQAVANAFSYDGQFKALQAPDVNSVVEAFERAVRRRKRLNYRAMKPLIVVEDLHTCVDSRTGGLHPQARLFASELLGLYERNVASVCFTLSDFRGINLLNSIAGNESLTADFFPSFPLLDLKEQVHEYLGEDREEDAELLVNTVGSQLGDLSSVVADMESGDSVNTALENLLRHSRARLIDSVTAWDVDPIEDALVHTEVAKRVFDALLEEVYVNWAEVTSHIPYRVARRVIESLCTQHVLTFSRYPTNVSFTRKALRHAWTQVREEPEIAAILDSKQQQ